MTLFVEEQASITLRDSFAAMRVGKEQQKTIQTALSMI